MPNDPVLKQLIASAQVLGLQNDPSLPASDRQILRMADEEKRALSPAEIQQICQSSKVNAQLIEQLQGCLLYTSPSPRDKRQSRMPSSA